VSQDLDAVTGGWDYDPSTVKARWVTGADGRRRVQLRLDLGVLQMEPAGRPDGRRPHGYVSLLDYYRNHERTAPAGRPFRLDAAACAELQQEAVQYYYRYLAFSALRHLVGVIEDTGHNLGILDLVERGAASPELAWPLLQFFPYVRMMNARSQAEQAMDESRFEDAIRAVEEGLGAIRTFGEAHGLPELAGRIREVEQLSELLVTLQHRQPASPRDRLRAELARAVEAEDFERAAALRDQLNASG
jgi:hypothetical protein